MDPKVALFYAALHCLYVPSTQAKTVVDVFNILLPKGKSVMDVLVMTAYAPEKMGGRNYFAEQALPKVVGLLEGLDFTKVCPIVFRKEDYKDVFYMVKGLAVLMGFADLLAIMRNGECSFAITKPGPWAEVQQALVSSGVILKGATWDLIAADEGAQFA